MNHFRVRKQAHSRSDIVSNTEAITMFVQTIIPLKYNSINTCIKGKGSYSLKITEQGSSNCIH